MPYLQPFLRRATRRRALLKDDDGSAKCQGQSEGEGFKKSLTTFDLVSLGVGSCCGTGMYLTVGLVSRDAGLGAAFSFIVAGVGSLLSGLCYAELAALCPRTSGSAYMYSYVTVGELVAFVIGWGLLVEYGIGTAATAVALSSAIDTMTNSAYGKIMLSVAGPFVGREYFDVIAVVVCLTLTLILGAGVEMSASFNNLLNFINFVVLVVFVLCSIPVARTDLFLENGIFPQGVLSAVSVIPTAYFAFIGFDIVATTGEEAKNPSTSIPKSIWISVLVNTVVYVAVTICLNNVVPYFSLSSNSAMIQMFATVGWPSVMYVVSAGAICALFAATFGSLFPLPRVLYAMAKDGLICKQLGYLCPTKGTPKLATIVSGCVAAFVSVTVNLSLLIEMVLIGTLLAYVLVAICVLILRYTNEESYLTNPSNDLETQEKDIVQGDETLPRFVESPKTTKEDVGFWKKIWRLCRGSMSPGESLRGHELAVVVGVLLASETCCCLTLVLQQNVFRDGNGLKLVYACVPPCVIVIFFIVFLLYRLPQNTKKPGFRVPCVPLLPVCVSFFNIYMMTSLSWITWCMFGVWMLLGLCVYIFFSHLQERTSCDKNPLLETEEDSTSSELQD